ncbi:MAPEG family protein [Cognatiyoonia koreensis]|uniref:MAPEG family protein n=1 Tax=Cognatiyoonia koreensis TaxID=364200 RepID=A0A1I0QB78_9RHOB|nr:MAPEG family protein [Cognatiyoonia koreensis]SEW24078.1 MAPEG family protein [Cognatiyoonia koreensis]
MTKRAVILLGMAAGLIWACAVVYYGLQWTQIGRTDTSPLAASATGLLFPGLVLVALIARLAQRRFFDDAMIDGQTLQGGALIDQRVLSNTIEQTVLAICIWPCATLLSGAVGLPIILGLSFLLARLLFWIGYHLSAPLRSLGFAATFYPTILTALYVLWQFVP